MIELQMSIKTPLGQKHEEQFRLSLRTELISFVKQRFDEFAQQAGITVGHESLEVKGEIKSTEMKP